jgi:hypothetical protein
MAAGLGYKEFTTGDVLTAADANGYLASQVVMVFADATARTAAITSPQEGMISFLKDTNATQYYSGSAWVTIGGGSSPLTTKGDVYTYSTADARLGVGANGTVLTADSAETTGLKWVTPASSALVLIKSQAIGSGVSTVAVTSAFSTTYDSYEIIISGGVCSNNSSSLGFQLGATTTGYAHILNYALFSAPTTPASSGSSNDSKFAFTGSCNDQSLAAHIRITDPFATKWTKIAADFAQNDAAGNMNGFLKNTTSYTDFTLIPAPGTLTGGTIYVYGKAK